MPARHHVERESQQFPVDKSCRLTHGEGHEVVVGDARSERVRASRTVLPGTPWPRDAQGAYAGVGLSGYDAEPATDRNCRDQGASSHSSCMQWHALPRLIA